MDIRKISDRLPKVVIIQGSPRDIDTCPNMNSKSLKVIDYIKDKYSFDIDIDVIDLSVNQSKKSIIQPCKGCISTSGGYHCHFPCDCYGKGDAKKPDLMKDLDVYERLKDCDAFIIISPIHWYALTSQVKAFFDRLVCASQTLSVDDARKLLGKGNLKNSELSGKLSKSGKYEPMLRNHLEGKVAAFLTHGDNGANDYSKNSLPESYDVMFDPYSDAKAVVMPYILQLKYSGIFVPDELVHSFYTNTNIDYYTANNTKNDEFNDRADNLVKTLIEYLNNLK